MLILVLMLQQFTWTDFWLVAVPLLAAWYGWLFFVLDRSSDISRQVSFGGVPGAGVSGFGNAVGSVGSGAEGLSSVEVMGKARMPEGVGRVVASDVVFADREGDDGEAEPGLVLDMLGELKELFVVLAREDGSKQDFFRLIGEVKEAFPGIGSHPGIAVVNAYVVEHAPFLISLQELESLWD